MHGMGICEKQRKTQNNRCKHAKKAYPTNILIEKNTKKELKKGIILYTKQK
jgi:hypothetical protein